MTGSSRSPVAFGQYIITRRIARGGMAEIYRARTRSHPGEPPRWVAVKMMRPAIGHEELREHLFKREARIASAIRHPNVVPLFQFGLEMGRYYIAMEYVRGRDLSHLLKNEKKGRELLPFEVGLYIGYRAAAGLGHAHRLSDERGEPLGIVHRDISPGNVMVGYDGQVKVLDFGVARINESEGMRTQTGTLRGKFAYMSPEQTLGESLDAKSDVFSLGTVLYELLTGSNCFRAEGPIATLERVQRVRPVPPSRAHREIPKAVDRILARCLAKDRSRRFPDGAALEEALGEFLDKRNFPGRDALAECMAERFAWERSEEEEELRREEEEVAIFDVIDFAMVGEDSSRLDARHVAVSQEEEASESEVKSVSLTGAREDAGDEVFESGDLEEREPSQSANARGAVQPGAEAWIPGTGAIPADDLSDLEATVAQPHRFDDDEPIAGRAVELSSLFGEETRAGRARSTLEAPVRKPERAASGSGKLDLFWVGRRAPDLGRGTAVASAVALNPMIAAVGEAVEPKVGLPARASVARRFRDLRRDHRALLSRPVLLAALFMATVIIVAWLVTVGMETRTSGVDPKKSADAAARRTTIAPVTITLDTQKLAAPSTRQANGDAPVVAEPAPVARSAGQHADDVSTGLERTTSVPAAEDRAALGREAAVKAPSKSSPRATRPSRPANAPIAPPAARIVAIKPAPKKAPAPTGFLNVGAKPWAEIVINGRPWPYQTPQAGIELPVGRHTVTLHNRETGVTRTQIVQIKPGVYRTISMDMSRASAR